jgi:hypothetical protein
MADSGIKDVETTVSITRGFELSIQNSDIFS